MQISQFTSRRTSRARALVSFRPSFGTTGKAGRLVLALALLTQGFFFGAAAVPSAQAQTKGVTGTPGTAVSATVDVGTIALEDELAPDASNNEPRVIHRPLSPATEGQALAGASRTAPRRGTVTTTTRVPNAEPGGDAPLIPSPSPSQNFLGLDDNFQVIPPDTMGAVSERYVVTTLNDRMRIQDRAGNVYNTVSTNSFWQPLATSMGTTYNTFDPKIYYDRNAQRFTYVITANGQSANSPILLAVSQTDNPLGTWNLYGLDADASNVAWADYPSVGFNRNWIVVQVNMFTVANNAFVRPDIYVFNKAQTSAPTRP